MSKIFTLVANWCLSELMFCMSQCQLWKIVLSNDSKILVSFTTGEKTLPVEN